EVARESLARRRTLAEIGGDLEREKGILTERLAELVGPLRQLVEERHGRLAAERAAAIAAATVIVPSEMSWAWFGLPKPAPPKEAKKLIMVSAIGEESMK